MDLSRRSDQKEYLDRDDIPLDAIERNMQELNIINTWLGGHAISIGGLKQLLKNFPLERGDEGRRAGTSVNARKKQVSICEIGSGGGDNLIVLSRYCRKRGIGVQLTGIDINPHCIAVARGKITDRDTRLIASDYRSVSFGEEKPDIIFSSLFCHHFTDDQLVAMLGWMQSNAGSGFFINDLQRNFFAWHAIRLLTRWFSRSWLVKNDAPLSVLRGFTGDEWKQIVARAGIKDYSLRWKWAFRWLLVVQRGSGS
jgi:2-polyprenyl-3-methyl-5-hydroxy-6-metoxy-1,4-benzoquinol methylase